MFQKSNLKLHTALVYNKNATSELLDLIDANPAMVGVTDLNSKLPLYIGIENGVDSMVVAKLLLLSLPISVNGSVVDFPNGAAHWIFVLTETNDRYVDSVTHVLRCFLHANQ
jgi:hypothetical protein